MEYQFTKGIRRPNAARLSLALSSILHDTIADDISMRVTKEATTLSSSFSMPMQSSITVLSTGSCYSQGSSLELQPWLLDNQAGTTSKPSGKLHSPLFTTHSIDNQSLNPTYTSTPSSVRPDLSFKFPLPDSSVLSSESESFYADRSSTAVPESTLEDRGSDHDSHRSEKGAKLKTIYSRSTKTITKMFSRPGIAHIHSMQATGPIRHGSVGHSTNPLQDFLPVDPFGPVNTFEPDVSLQPRPFPFTHKDSENALSSKGRHDLSLDLEASLVRSPSLHFPRGIPPSPSLGRVRQLSQTKRGRDSPFPVADSRSNTASPVPSSAAVSRGRAVSQSSTTVPREVTTRAKAHKRSKSSVETSQLSWPLPVPTERPPLQASASKRIQQRPRAKSVPRDIVDSDETSSEHDGRSSDVAGDLSFLDKPPPARPQRGAERARQLRAAREGVIFSPSFLPSLGATFLSDSFAPSPMPEDAQTSANVQARAHVNDPDVLYSDAVQQGTAFTRDSHTKSTLVSPSRPSSVRQQFSPKASRLGSLNFPTSDENRAKFASSLRTQRPIPRSPSLPYLTSDLSSRQSFNKGKPVLRREPEKTRHRVLKHSPSVPDFVLKSSPGNPQVRQPLPPSIAERLRTRARSMSRSEERPTLREGGSNRVSSKTIPSLASISSADSTEGFLSSPAQNSASSAISSAGLLSPPSQAVSVLLKDRSRKRHTPRTLSSSSSETSQTLTSVSSFSSLGTKVSVEPPSPSKKMYFMEEAEAPPPAPFFRRSRPNLRRSKELSYPLTQSDARNFADLAKTNGWGFLGKPPPVPSRSSLPTVPPPTPIRQKVDGSGTLASRVKMRPEKQESGTDRVHREILMQRARTGGWTQTVGEAF